MHISWALLASIALSISSSTTATPAKRYYDTHRYYALEHRPDGASLEDVTNALGLEVVEQAGELKDVWLVRIPQPDVNTDLDERGDLDPVLAAFHNLQDKANSHLTSRSEEANHVKRIVSSVTFLEPQIPRELVKRAPLPDMELEERAPPTRASAAGVAKRLGLKDPLFTEQWHLVNDEYPEHMMNTTPVWDMGLTGKGVLTSFLDDGLDFETDDLKDAFVIILSFLSLHFMQTDWLSTFTRTQNTPMTSTPTYPSPDPPELGTTMAHAAQAKSPLGETKHAASASPTTLKPLVCGSSQDPSPP